MKTPILRVTWIDSASISGWQDPDDEDVSPIACVSVGQMVKRTKTALSLSSTMSCQGRCIDPLSIPLGCIVQIETLAGKPTTHERRKRRRK